MFDETYRLQSSNPVSEAGIFYVPGHAATCAASRNSVRWNESCIVPGGCMRLLSNKGKECWCFAEKMPLFLDSGILYNDISRLQKNDKRNISKHPILLTDP